MAAVKHEVQTHVFGGGGDSAGGGGDSEERLVALCHVTKHYKKKKVYLLCLVSHSGNPTLHQLYKDVKPDKENRDNKHRNSFKKKRAWPLDQLHSLDGGTDPQVFAIDINAEKQYKWIAMNDNDRQNFIMAIWQAVNHNKFKMEFINFPKLKTLEMQSLSSPESPLNIPIRLPESESGFEYQTMATELDDASDLISLIGNCDTAISNAEQFMSQLGDTLSVLDRENIESMLESEAQVDFLMDKLEEAISYVETVECRLDRYDEMLCHIRDTLDKMEEKNGMIETANRNSQRLLQQLENVINWLDVNGASVDIVLTTPEGREAALNAGNIIRNTLQANQPPSLKRLAAAQEQIKKVHKYKEKFTQALTRHLNNLLIHLGNDASQEFSMLGADGLTLPRRSHIHNELLEYAPLMHWTKEMDPRAYSALNKVYTTSLSKLYDRDIKQFFEHARQLIGVNDKPTNVKEKKSKTDIKEDGSSHSTSSHSFDAILEIVLTQLEPVCLSEQQFCVAFFQLDSFKKNLDGSFNPDLSTSLIVSPSSDDLSTKDLSPSSGELQAQTQDQGRSRQEKLFSEDVRKMMAELFPSLEQELAAFIAHYERVDAYGCMQTLVVVGSHVMSARDAGSLLSVSLGSCLVQAKRACDAAIRRRLQSFSEPCKATQRKQKCGILSYVESFEEFCKTAESIFSKSSRRADLDKWYVQLVTGMIQAIQRQDHPRTPHQVIKMENFHHLYSLLCQTKITALDGLRKDCKIKYNDSLRAYVTLYFGRPLEKLNQFFEGVESRVSQGVNKSEILYQAAFSKQELRKVISLYPHREVKKGLESLYKKVEKHLCEEENLLQVVWRAMQEEFITQYKYLEEHIQQCYPGSMIALDFTIKDILETFSEIARSH